MTLSSTSCLSEHDNGTVLEPVILCMKSPKASDYLKLVNILIVFGVDATSFYSSPLRLSFGA